MADKSCENKYPKYCYNNPPCLCRPNECSEHCEAKPTPEPDKKELVGITIGGITSHIDPAQILNMVEIDCERLYEIISDVISNVGAKNINENTIRNLAGTIAVANPITITKEKE